ncbi:hypothetical protein A3C60_01375 [Candidatus Nomurabacteria bacterium RIFCSPHIGHO2_02_FULL_37_45]|uniref:Endolytic murein transglycosylase n=1 Tax=Candidatus Nomurabacteria bacterium RIFCSPLOWO2_12_FULL_37_8 TaxID=1801793 RepID=A0A1F6Y3M7_9BACT|nr:MAG: hypothetical protein A2727_02040 [Candidatus Nomurabacteria bacterium RIFCSPHIGHO2_01_FULL_37_110]OGI71286.1 MAG: hypothetical protein A3C60_01375 [Candidatus Nomurabacteria bacterium RIFCSPHIGHO2_02_FULL_37_45]OGJ00987.1 MAG: hypothetical protein A3G98_00595 [Candidatus Nomurabacteria bacterium RIFCSPLOWO2_12_FULL_37_8]
MGDFSTNDQLGHPISKLGTIKKIVFYALYLVTFLFFVFFFFLSAPADFIPRTVIRIEQGTSLRGVSLQLKREYIIRSSLAFEAFVIIYGGEKHIMSADYLFENKLPVFEIARRISKGEHHMPLITVTIPEGFDTTQIGEIFTSKLVNFDKTKFLSKAKKLEGYLFPDTYFFFTTNNEENVIKSMSENFNKKIKSLMPEITKLDKTEKEIIIMASIIEREAKGDADRGFISGILWKRLVLGMALQVDAAPETYETRGLPKSPIGNPGLEALQAAINPEKSSYLYYLHDKSGNIHYAKNFVEHQVNIKKYLKN